MFTCLKVLTNHFSEKHNNSLNLVGLLILVEMYANLVICYRSDV